ncbi:MAG: hypothetical protein ACLFPW_12065, partial [Spirochaetaceae bacterium]
FAASAVGSVAYQPEAIVKVNVELELDLDLKELSLAELQRIIRQLVSTDESRVVKEAKVKEFKILR